MNRRNAIKGLATVLGGLGAGFQVRLTHAAHHSGKLLVSVQAHGGWDPTCFCDPKTNTPGEPVITHWSEWDSVQQAGNIPYAPFANNADFFEKHAHRMLVINGVDAQTNSHSAGITHNWSGRISEGFPTLTALSAGHLGDDMAAPYLSFGGFSRTQGVTRFTRLDNPRELRNIAYPTKNYWGREIISDENWDSLEAYRSKKLSRLALKSNRLPGESFQHALYESAMLKDELKRFADAIPPEDQLEDRVRSGMIPGSDNEYWSTLRRQVQLAVLAMATGTSVSADLFQTGFDTHAIHDPDAGWLLGQLTNGIDFLWEYAREYGIDDRLVVLVGSDFARTNYYNSTDGKDHWPISSFIVMENNQPWTNRVVEGSDHLQFSRKVNPKTLQPDEIEGMIIYPKHVHKALRRYLGIDQSVGSARYPFNNVEDFAFFDDLS